MMLAINLGSRGLDEARNFVEYVNGPAGSYWGDLRKPNGRADPWNVKLWCLGNEMDGPWQVGHKTPTNTAGSPTRPPRRCAPSTSRSNWSSAARRIRTCRPIPNGSARCSSTPTSRSTTSRCTCTSPIARRTPPNYLALNEKLDAYIGTVASTIEFVRAKKRSQEEGHISFDEWNVWYHSNAAGPRHPRWQAGWPHAPRLLEDVYNFEDVLQVGCILNTFIRRSDVVKLACIAQLVNVIAPIMTEPRGRGLAADHLLSLLLRLASSAAARRCSCRRQVPGYDAEVADNVPYLDISGVHDEAGGTLTFFAVNRHASETHRPRCRRCRVSAPRAIIDHQVMTHADLRGGQHRKPTQRPSRPRRAAAPGWAEGRLTGKLAPLFVSDDPHRPRLRRLASRDDGPRRALRTDSAAGRSRS